MNPRFFVGLDLGQSSDFTALVALDRIGQAPYSYLLRYIKRFPLKTSYPDILTGVSTIVKTPPLPGNTALVIDGTGVGAPMVDLFAEANLPVELYGVNITGGNEALEYEDHKFRVPKRDLATVVKILLDGGRLKIRQELPERGLLEKELQTFRVKINTKTAHDSYEAWREGDHDDLVLALALACWLGERPKPEMFGDIKKPDPQPSPEQHTRQFASEDELKKLQTEQLAQQLRSLHRR